MGKATIGTLEAMIRSMVVERGLPEFATALNNAFCFGEVFTDNEEFGGFSDDELDQTLEKIFEGVEKFIEAGKIMNEDYHD